MKKTVAILLFLAIFISGCNAKTKEINSEKIKVVSTLFCEYDFVRAVAGDLAENILLIPPGNDIHTFEPTISDIKNISDCDIFIYIGGESDTWVERILKGIENKNITVLKMSEKVNLLREEDEPDEYDEHIWTSPDNAIKMVNAISTALQNKDKANKEIYAKNAKIYTDKISDADKTIREVIKNNNITTITVADRNPLLYFGEYYNIEIVAAFGGCDADTDADVKTVAKLINAVKQNELSAVYTIELSNKNLAATVCENTNAKMYELHSAHNISANDFKNGITYTDIMLNNAKVLCELRKK